MATTFTTISVKESTKAAKQAATMTLVYHYWVYMIFHQLLSVEDSMLTPAFAAKLAAAKTEEQLDQLVKEVMEKQLPSPIQKHWDIPSLEEMELEIIHLSTYWKDTKRVNYIIVLSVSY